MYQKLYGRDEETAVGTNDNIVQETNEISDKSSAVFSIKILLKESVTTVPGLSETTTIIQLKNEIEKLTNVAVGSQRLIFSGH